MKFSLPAYYTSILKHRRRSSPHLIHVSCNEETVSTFLENLLSVTREIRQVDYTDVTPWGGHTHTHTHTHTKMRKKQVDELWPTTRTQTNYPPAINKLLCPAFTSLHRSQFRFFNFTFINRIFHTTMKGKRASILEEAAASLNKISQNLHECTMKRHKTLWSATISMRSESSPVDSSFVYLRCYTSMLICFCT